MTKNEQSKEFSRPNLSETPVNKTTHFMLPALNFNIEKTSFKLLKYFGLVNCYIGHKQGLDTNPTSVYMVFNPSMEAIKRFHQFYDIYKTYPNFIRDYVVDKNLIVLVFKIKDKWMNSFKSFRESKYSEMSKEYAELFKRPDLATGKVHVGREYYVIHKHKDLKVHMEEELGVKIDDSWELMDPLDLSKEIFDYDRRITEV